MKILQINSSARQEGSNSTRLANTIVARLLSVNPNLQAEEDIAKILSSVQGARKGVEDRKYCVVLNKCDDEIRKERAEKIRSLLKEKSIENVMITNCENRQNELKKYF